VEIQIKTLSIHLPRLEDFALDHLAATPVASNLAAISAKVREQIGTAVLKRLRPYVDSDGVTYPEETYFVTAHL
jgi:hypothetical protein